MVSRHARLRTDPDLIDIWRRMGRPDGCQVVGGWVRDRLMGRASRDLDLSMAGSASTVERAARRLAASYRVSAHLLGRPPRAVWQIPTDHLKIELWPLADLDLEADAQRRDFTVNALAWTLPDGPIHDFVGGLPDLEDRCLRAVSYDNLEADPVRLLRAFRFLAEHPAFRLDPVTEGWIRELSPLLHTAPPERVGPEMLRLLQGPAAARCVAAAVHSGIAAAVAPSASTDGSALADLAPAAGRLAARGAHPIRPAVAAAGDAAHIGLLAIAWQPAPDRDLAAFAWPQEVRRRGVIAARLHAEMNEAVDGPAADRRELIHRAGRAFPAALALAAAVKPEAGWRRWWRLWLRSGARIVTPTALISTAEVAELLGLPEGPRLGQALAQLTKAQVRGEIRSRAGAQRLLAGIRDSLQSV